MTIQTISRGQQFFYAARTAFIATGRRPLLIQIAFQHTLLQGSKRHVAHTRPSLQLNEAELTRLNSATLGAEMPEITLANGQKVQTGTVGALLRNIFAYDELIRLLDSTTEAQKNQLNAEVAKYELMLKTPLPLLQKVGLFDLFSPEEWVNGGTPGRKFVGRCALAAGYQIPSTGENGLKRIVKP